MPKNNLLYCGWPYSIGPRDEIRDLTYVIMDREITEVSTTSINHYNDGRWCDRIYVLIKGETTSEYDNVKRTFVWRVSLDEVMKMFPGFDPTQVPMRKGSREKYMNEVNLVEEAEGSFFGGHY